MRDNRCVGSSQIRNGSGGIVGNYTYYSTVTTEMGWMGGLLVSYWLRPSISPSLFDPAVSPTNSMDGSSVA
jgi:hypothetical protein